MVDKLKLSLLGEAPTVRETDPKVFTALVDLIEKYEQYAAYNIAYVLAFRDEADHAFEWLDKAVQYSDPGLTNIADTTEFLNIQNDPRWLPFLERIGKSPSQLDAIEFKVNLPR